MVACMSLSLVCLTIYFLLLKINFLFNSLLVFGAHVVNQVVHPLMNLWTLVLRSDSFSKCQKTNDISTTTYWTTKTLHPFFSIFWFLYTFVFKLVYYKMSYFSYNHFYVIFTCSTDIIG